MRRILLTTDGSENALKGAHYLANLYQGAPDLEINILNISPKVPPLFADEIYDPAVKKQFAAWKKKKEEEGQKHIEAATHILVRGGFKQHQIQGQYLQQRVGVARDIIREADGEKYGAIVTGKKGMSWVEEMFLGSITNKLLEISEDHPLWVVEGKNLNARRVLIAIDETKHAVELTRYAGQMLQGLKGVEILLYYFCPPPLAEALADEEKKEILEMERRFVERRKERMAQLFEEARKTLVACGMDLKGIQTRFYCEIPPGDKKISQAILAEAQQGNFGTVVMGRKGSTHAREFRLGSVALRTVTEAENCAVWVV